MTGTRKRCLLGGCVASVIIAQADPAGAADISRLTADHRTVILAGRIVEGDARKLTRVLTDGSADQGVTAVNLNSPGGLVAEAYRIAAIVHHRGITTRVSGHAMCTSACFLIFASGRHKLAEPGARIGVHSARELTGIETDRAMTVTVEMARVLQSYGVPEQIVGKMVLATPTRMAWLSADELRSMGVQVATGATASAVPGVAWPVPTPQAAMPADVTARITPTPVATQVVAPWKPANALGRLAAPYGWMIELGGFPDEAAARERLKIAKDMAPDPLISAEPYVERLIEGSGEYRARFAGLDKDAAEAACHDLTQGNIACAVLVAPSGAVGGAGSSTDRFVVLLPSQKSEAEARRHFRLVQAALQIKYLSVWDRQPVTRSAERGDGVVYRAEVGPFTTIDLANQFCRELEFQCTVERN